MSLKGRDEILPVKSLAWCFLGKQAQKEKKKNPLLNNEVLSTRKVSYDYKLWMENYYVIKAWALC